MFADQEEDSTLVDGEGGRGEPQQRRLLFGVGVGGALRVLKQESEGI